MITKVSTVGLMLGSMVMGAILQGLPKQTDATDMLRTHELEVVDNAGRVRWRIWGQDKNSQTARIQGLDIAGKERFGIEMGIGWNPVLEMTDPLTKQPVLMLEIESGSEVPSLKMFGRGGSGSCNNLTLEPAEKDVWKGVLRTQRSDGYPVDHPPK